MANHYAITVAWCLEGDNRFWPKGILTYRSSKPLKQAVADAFAEGRRVWGTQARVVVYNRVYRHFDKGTRCVYIKSLVDPDGSIYGNNIRTEQGDGR